MLLLRIAFHTLSLCCMQQEEIQRPSIEQYVERVTALCNATVQFLEKMKQDNGEHFFYSVLKPSINSSDIGRPDDTHQELLDTYRAAATSSQAFTNLLRQARASAVSPN